MGSSFLIRIRLKKNRSFRAGKSEYGCTDRLRSVTVSRVFFIKKINFLVFVIDINVSFIYSRVILVFT